MDFPWTPYQRPLAVDIAITSTSPIRLDFPPGRFTVTEPLVFVTVNGGPTHVTTTSPKESVVGYGEIHTHVTVTFPSGLVGLRAFVWVMGL